MAAPHASPNPVTRTTSPYHIPQLWQFVQARTPQEAPDSRDSWVIPEFVVSQPFSLELRMLFQEFPQDAVRIGNHAAELQAIESFAVATDPAMAKDDVAALTAK